MNTQTSYGFSQCETTTTKNNNKAGSHTAAREITIKRQLVNLPRITYSDSVQVGTADYREQASSGGEGRKNDKTVHKLGHFYGVSENFEN